MRINLQPVLLAAAALTASPVAGAAESIDVERIVACSKQRNDARRLACYDSAVGGIAAEVEVPPPVATAKASPAPPAMRPSLAEPAAAESEFGVTGSAVARQRSDTREQAKGDSGISSISAVVTAVTRQPRGELVITLDNGQAWAQKRADSYFPIKPGDQVTINAGMLGSFRLSNGNRQTQVTRLK